MLQWVVSAALASLVGCASGGDGDGDGPVRPGDGDVPSIEGRTPIDGGLGATDGNVTGAPARAVLDIVGLDIWGQPLPPTDASLQVTRDECRLAA